MDSVPSYPNIWMWTLGPATQETLDRFCALTRTGELNWIIIPLPSGTVEDLVVPPGFHAAGSEEI